MTLDEWSWMINLIRINSCLNVFTANVELGGVTLQGTGQCKTLQFVSCNRFSDYRTSNLLYYACIYIIMVTVPFIFCIHLYTNKFMFIYQKKKNYVWLELYTTYNNKRIPL